MYINLCTLLSMNTEKSMTIDEVRNLPPLSEQERRSIENAKANPDSSCPELTPEQLETARPAYVEHPEWFRPRKVDVHLKIDIDVLEAFKAQGKGYQTRINEVLRKAVFSL